MESLLGFHPPHFSEEAAWLPGWLQSSTIREASNQAFQRPSGQRLEEIGRLQQNMCTRENDNLSDNSGCKSFHLYLSGEGTSTNNFPSLSSNHEVQYHLHLSSNEESQSLSTPVLSKSQPERHDLNQAPIIHQPNSKPITHEVNNPSPQKGNSGASPTFKGQNRKSPKSCKVDITDAVELAVAASEALIIHEVVKDEPSSQLSAPSFVLEAALRVKQARLEEVKVKVKETVGFEESNEADFLSDLDELTMADAYEDVGLTLTSTSTSTPHGDNDHLTGYESISHVKDSYADFGCISSKQEVVSKRRFLLESIENKEDVDYAELGVTGNADLGCDVDLVFSCSANFCMKEVGLQRVIGDPTSCQTVLRSSRVSECNEREDSLVPDKFQSRWFGGWTSKSDDEKHKRRECPPQVFNNETSSLSESADIAPDMNSAIQNVNISPNNANSLSQNVNISQSSNNTLKKKENSPSDDVTGVVVPNSSSPMDLFCSVVPCSFTSDTLPLNLTPDNLNNTEMVPDSLHDKTESPPVRRQVSSLKTYSMLSYPPYDPYLNKQPIKPPIFDFQEQETELPSHTEKKTKTPMTLNTKETNIKTCLVPRRKRVRFSEPEISQTPVKKKPKTRVKKHHATILLQNLDFLLTGFSVNNHKEIKNLIQKNGGIVLDDIPPPPTHRTKRHSKYQHPLILCPKRSLTTKFLYGCAVNACILKVNWLYDSLSESSILPLKKYMILKRARGSLVIGKAVSRSSFIFENVAVMLHGRREFCTKMAKVVKHGGGLVFKTIHWLVKRVESDREVVGAIVVEGENGISRHLKQCAVEQNIAVLTSDWIVKSLYEGRVLPSPGFKHPSNVHLELSEEI